MMSQIVHELVYIAWEQNQVLNTNLQCRLSHLHICSHPPHDIIDVHFFHEQLLHDMPLIPPDVFACPSLKTLNIVIVCENL